MSQRRHLQEALEPPLAGAPAVRDRVPQALLLLVAPPDLVPSAAEPEDAEGTR